MTVRSTQPVTVTWHPQVTPGRTRPVAKGQRSPNLSPQHSHCLTTNLVLIWMRHGCVGKRLGGRGAWEAQVGGVGK